MIKFPQSRSLTTIGESKSHKVDDGLTRNACQTHLQIDVAKIENITEQKESTLKDMLDKENSPESNGFNYLTSIFADRDCTRSVIINHILESKDFIMLQNLDLSRALLKRRNILALSYDNSLQQLKVLNLSENSLGNDGIKLLAENYSWRNLQTLILCDTNIDHIGAKHLVANESWTSLQELNLNKNPLLGNLGAVHISYNTVWAQFKKLSLWNCNVEMMGIRYMQHNRLLRVYSEMTNFINHEEKIRNQEHKISKRAHSNYIRRSPEVRLALVLQSRELNRRSVKFSR